MSRTSIEKIAQSHATGWSEGRAVHAGDYLMIRPRHVMTHDNTSAILGKFKSLGKTRVKFPDQPVFTLDHNIQDKSDKNLAKYEVIRNFAESQGITAFPAGYGIGHQIMLEEGFAVPGAFVVASDSHSNIYGAVAALGTPVVRTDAAAIWATGQTWWQVPDTVRVNLTGKLRAGVTGKDLIQVLCWRFGGDEVLNCCVEFSGPGVESLAMPDRMAVANMSTEWGALAGVFPYDSVTEAYLLSLAARFAERGDDNPRLTERSVRAIDPAAFSADGDAFYAKTIEVNLATVSPLVTGPDEVKTARPAAEIEREDVRIDKAYLLSCVNARLEDFAQAAQVMAGRGVAPHVKLYIAAASANVQRQAEQFGYWQTLLDAGAIELPPGCGPCIGLGSGTLEAGETAISATNRNFKGRMGDRSAKAYLASPATVAASAVAGKIAAPFACDTVELIASISEATREAPAPEAVEIVPGMPGEIAGRLLLLAKDNMNTDGIYGKEATYRDDLTPSQMAGYAFNNYDPEFQRIAAAGDIILGGWNFGCGSSREQAATALQFFGIALVLAGSFSQTYKRNAFNNGLLCVECPSLLEHLRREYSGDPSLTIVEDRPVLVNFSESLVLYGDRKFPIAPVSKIPQQLVAAGGLEAQLKSA